MLDIGNTRHWLRIAKIEANTYNDKVVVGGDLSSLKGYIEPYGGRLRNINFEIMLRTNGVFIDYVDSYGDSYIKKLSVDSQNPTP